jgi:regulator of protease activity HflC (stomatin/prohibitin superfamily)
MDFFSFVMFAVGAVLFVFLKGFKFVPQQSAWVIERLGKYDRTLVAGMGYVVPILERVAYKHSLKEYAHDVHEQTAITRDNVTLVIDGVLYMRILDPYQASYGVSDPVYAVTQLAQTTMRSEIGKLALDQSFEERETLNTNIVVAINHAAQTWGIQCMRYEIKNINPPTSVLKAMELQMSAERQKRAEILASEGERQAKINIAEGKKQEVVLASEANQLQQINLARGEAEAILAVSEATAKGIELIAMAIKKEGGEDAVSLKIAERYIDAFKQLARQGTTVLMPANVGDAGSMVAQAMTVFDTIRQSKAAAHSLPSSPLPSADKKATK